MEDCIFCKIIKSEIPCAKVYEDEDVLAFLDIMPVNKGHTLVISKEHYYNIEDAPIDVISKVMSVVKKLSTAVKKAADTEGFVVMQSNGKSAEQLVPHLHFHIIPKFKDDGLKYWPQGKYEEGEIEEYRKKVIENI